MCLDQFWSGGIGQHQPEHRQLPRPVAVEQCVQQRCRRLRPLLPVTEIRMAEGTADLGSPSHADASRKSLTELAGAPAKALLWLARPAPGRTTPPLYGRLPRLGRR